jgi:hypothetical protein
MAASVLSPSNSIKDCVADCKTFGKVTVITRSIAFHGKLPLAVPSPMTASRRREARPVAIGESAPVLIRLPISTAAGGVRA